MKNPIAIFTAAALATLAALAGLSMSIRPGGPSDGQKPAEAASQAQDQTVQGTAEKAPDQKPAVVEESSKTPEKPTEMAAIPVPEPPKPAAEVRPELDTVRVESDGQAIVAGRAQPGAEIALKLGGQVIGKGLANSDGSWVVVPDQPLPKGAHEISIEQKTPDSAPVTAEQSIAVAVPEKAGQQAMVALTEPGTATRVLQAGGAQEQASLSEEGQTQPEEMAEPPQEPAATAEEPVVAAQEPAAATAEPSAAAPEQTAAAQGPSENAQPAGKPAEPSTETTVAKVEVP